MTDIVEEASAKLAAQQAEKIEEWFKEALQTYAPVRGWLFRATKSGFVGKVLGLMVETRLPAEPFGAAKYTLVVSGKPVSTLSISANVRQVDGLVSVGVDSVSAKL